MRAPRRPLRRPSNASWSRSRLKPVNRHVQRLQGYLNARRLYRQDEDGNPVYLDAAEIDAARAAAEQDVADRCE